MNREKIYTPLRILFLLGTFAACRPSLPETSTITIDMESATTPVNGGLYGLLLNEKDLEHTDGNKLYAELIPNHSFESADDSIIQGWRCLSPYTYIRQSTIRPVSLSNLHSLMVAVYAGYAGRGGIAAGGREGIPIRKGGKYHLSFLMRTSASVTPVPVHIALEDSSASRQLSDVYEVTPSHEWTRYHHTFTATEDANNAVLSFFSDHTSFFRLDMVSLFPDKTWKNRPHGFRPDIMEKIAALHPAFVLYRGNTNHDTFQDYLQMCEDLNAETVYSTDSSESAEKYLYG